jgi:hypothetical protein
VVSLRLADVVIALLRELVIEKLDGVSLLFQQVINKTLIAILGGFSGLVENFRRRRHSICQPRRACFSSAACFNASRPLPGP